MKKSIKILLLLALFLGDTISVQAQSKAIAAVKKVLHEQSIAWNKGNIDAYMEGYWRSPKLQFIGSRGLTYGWQQTLDNYKKSYPDQATMGQLTFDVLEVEQLSRKVVMLSGKYTLDRAAKENLSGYFLLVWKKIKGKWVVIADHTN